jgi:serine protease Do
MRILLGAVALSACIGIIQPTSLMAAPDTGSAAVAEARSLSSAFKRVAREVTPAVVNIQTVRRTQIEDPLTRFGPFLFGPPGGAPFPPREFEQQGQGSGVIVSPQGDILTNAHVVRDADEVTVSLHDRRQFTARVVGTDEKTDIAILRIDNAGNLPVARLGDSDAIEVGDWVVAIGNPFGLDATVTAGIISAKGRASVGVADYEDFLQTDAAINPGNSGGALVDLDGRLIGINTAIVTRGGGFNGIGFAIPINMAHGIMESILTDGKVRRGWLGVSIQNLTPELAQSFNYSGGRGVLIGDVTPDGPAAKAGLQPGDIVTQLNGEPVDNINTLRLRVASIRPGTEATLRVYRNGAEQTITITVGELESAVTLAANGTPPVDLGLTLQELTPALRQQLRLADSDNGVVISAVTPNGIARRAGLQPGDVILAVNNRRITTLREFNEAIAAGDLNAGIRLQVVNGGMRRFVILRNR